MANNIYLMSGFDTEAPRIDDPFPSQLDEREYGTLHALEGIKRVFVEQFDSPVTLFLVGGFLDTMAERHDEDFVRGMIDSSDPRFDLQQHSYLHKPLREIPQSSFRPISLADITADIQKASERINYFYGADVVGLRSPFGYLRGLQGFPEIVDALLEAGIKYVSSDLRGSGWTIEPELVDEEGRLRHPYFVEGTRGRLLREIPSVGFQDYAFTNREGAPKNAPKEPKAIADYFAGLFDQAVRVAEKMEQDVFVGLCFHPQDMHAYDPQYDSHKRMLESALEKGLEPISYTDAYRRLQA